MMRTRTTILAGGLVFALAGYGSWDSRRAEATAAPASERTGAAYGFRYDPIKWVKSSKSVQGALVRAFAIQCAKARDRELLREEVAQILAQQKDDGSFPPDDPRGSAVGGTVGKVRRLLERGCSADRPEIKRAVEFVCRRKLKEKGHLDGGVLRLACLTGWSEGAEPVQSLHRLAKHCKTHPERGACPWTIGEAETLWAGRHLADVTDATAWELSWIPERMNDAGFNSYKDPWAFLELAGAVDHPLAREIVLKQIPMILRSQRANGGWGQKSYVVFRALTRYGLLKPLCKLPPLPSDWRIVRSIPAPAKNLWTMTWHGSRLWVLCRGTSEAIAVSPEDGKVLKRLKLPTKRPAGIGRWDQCLAVSRWDPKGVAQIDPETGEIKRQVMLEKWLEEPGGVTEAGGKLWVADGWNWVVIRVNPKKPDGADHVLMACPTGGWGTDLAAADDGVWHFDRSWAALVKTDAQAKAVEWNEEAAANYHNAKLLDWGEKPFPGLAGIAWDGMNLWALDNVNQRICIIERTKAGEAHHGWLPAGTNVLVGPIFASGGKLDSARATCHVENATRFPAKATIALAPGSKLTARPATIELDVPANTTRTRDIEIRASAPTDIADVPVPVLTWRVTYRIDDEKSHEAKGQHRVPILPQFDCVRTEGKIVVDGKLDDWAALPFVVDKPEQVKNRPTYTGPSDCRFRFGVVHDDRYLYVAVETTDDKQYLNPRKLVWQQDGVEIRLNAEPEPHRSHCRGWDVGWDRVLKVLVSPGQKPGDMVRWQHEKLPGGAQVACVKTATGHNTEVAIPVSYLDTKQGVPWQVFRLNVAVDDVDTDGQVAQLWWKPDWREMQTYAGSGTFRLR